MIEDPEEVGALLFFVESRTGIEIERFQNPPPLFLGNLRESPAGLFPLPGPGREELLTGIRRRS
ncbi:MAG TPA: hypothetical protein DCS85_08220 [Verrucomicrobiales bacterium]|nr:hypothetical protein [Verrucomicrobiales bacterium]